MNVVFFVREDINPYVCYVYPVERIKMKNSSSFLAARV